jgi:hypothetical protein
MPILGMSISEILCSLYVVVGVVVAVRIQFSDHEKNKISGIGQIAGMANSHWISFLIFAVLWPVWLGILWFGSRNGADQTTQWIADSEAAKADSSKKNE